MSSWKLEGGRDLHSNRHPRESGDPAYLMAGGWSYMMANRYRGTVYTGVTADIRARVWQHKQSIGSKFAAEYGLKLLVYVEPHDRIEDAITREKRIKKWRRQWKIELIESLNPDWLDLWDTINN